MSKLFGTDGIRGIVNEANMNTELALRLGQSLVVYCQKNNIAPIIMISRDTRGSGPMLELAVSAGIMSMGGKVISLGIIPTPGLAFMVKQAGIGMGLMVSASHNDYSYNGFKLFKNDGTKMNEQEEEELENIILRDKFNFSIGKEFVNSDLENIDLMPTKKYSEFLINALPENIGENLKIVLDCANGATSEIAPIVFEQIGAEIVTIADCPDGKNINDDCGSQYTANLSRKVVEEGAHLGLAFDGDGDRMIAVTEDGSVLTGDQLLYIYAQLLLELEHFTNKVVVSTVMSNISFINNLKKLGIEHVVTDVGDRAVYQAMQERGTTGDGILSGLMLVWAMKVFNKPLSELANQFVLAPKVLVNVPVKEKTSFDLIPEIVEEIRRAEEVLQETGRVLVRYSGTENLCRVMVEGESEEQINSIANDLARIIIEKLN
ncbi:MAG: Phosphoglucosamine mutase [Parcubacteria group bacterium GW2011_GWE2_38_18]|nr:MAG: Phosphoglucosamine mutase [Parcubacteria group bacterium GW2011_GWE2_38_18]